MNALQITYELANPMDLAGLRIPARQIIGKLCPWRYQGATVGDGACLFPSNSTVTLPTSSGTETTYAFFDKDDNILLPFGHSEIKAPWPTGSFTAAEYRVYNSATDDPGGINGIYLITKNYESPPPPVPSTTNIDSENYLRAFTYTTYNAGSTYSFGDLVFYNDHIWKSLENLNTGKTPAEGTRWWTRHDLCSKSMDGCRFRFQYQALITNDITIETKDSGVIAPHWEPNTDVSNVVPFGGFPPSEKI
jgi:hypothetical protein